MSRRRGARGVRIHENHSHSTPGRAGGFTVSGLRRPGPGHSWTLLSSDDDARVRGPSPGRAPCFAGAGAHAARGASQTRPWGDGSAPALHRNQREVGRGGRRPAAWKHVFQPAARRSAAGASAAAGRAQLLSHGAGRPGAESECSRPLHALARRPDRRVAIGTRPTRARWSGGNRPPGPGGGREPATSARPLPLSDSFIRWRVSFGTP